jgi:non-canonical (house-cleaning) NTP pyrophosphatase
VGLEGGFHSTTFDGARHTFLRGWAYATDGARGYFGAAPSVTVPAGIVARVEGQNSELGEVIDAVAGATDVRSRQGAWGRPLARPADALHELRVGARRGLRAVLQPPPLSLIF